MWLISDEQPVIVRTKTGDVRLEPGVPCELSDAVGQRVLERSGGKVRQTSSSDVQIEPATPTARPVYWEGPDRKLYGPAVPEFLGKVGGGDRERFWIVVTHESTIRWIRSDRLRALPLSRKQVGK